MKVVILSRPGFSDPCHHGRSLVWVYEVSEYDSGLLPFAQKQNPVCLSQVKESIDPVPKIGMPHRAGQTVDVAGERRVPFITLGALCDHTSTVDLWD